MTVSIATATEIQNNFDYYLNMVMNGHEVVVTKDGRKVGRFIPNAATPSCLTDSLTGILEGEYDLKAARAERLEQKLEAAD